MCVLNVHVCGCSWVGEVGVGSPGAGVADICELCCILETQLGSSKREVHTKLSPSFELGIHCNPVWSPGPPTSAL